MSAAKKLYHRLSSLKITVVLLMLTIVLVFVGTIAQAQMGIEPAVAKFFRAWLVFADVGGVSLPVFPGGFLLGFLLLINLIAAQTRHFRLNWRDAGIWMTHGSILILLLGEFVIAMVQQEWVMSLDEGEQKQYVEAYKRAELAFTKPLGDGQEQVVAFNPAALKAGKEFEVPESDLSFKVLETWPHADLIRGAGGSDFQKAGQRFVTRPGPVPTAPDEMPHPAAVLELQEDGEPLGKYLVSLLLQPQTLEGSNDWSVGLRLERKYLPFSLKLNDFIHERHAGTSIPSRFSSLLTMTDVGHSEAREIEITMNEPMRRDGWTFYQHSFDNNDLTSILHAVKNPAQALPYIACLVGAIGLCWQFGYRLLKFQGKRRKAEEKEAAATDQAAGGNQSWRPDWVILALALVPFLFVARGLATKPVWDDMPLSTFLEQPVLSDGRLKPLDTIGKSALLVIHGKSNLRVPTDEAPTFIQQMLGREPTRKIPSSEWLAELLFDFKSAEQRPIFRVENIEVLQSLGINETAVPANLPFSQLDPLLSKLSEEARQAGAVKKEKRTRYQRDILKLFNQLRLYLSLTPSLLPDPGAVVDVVRTTPSAARAISADPNAAASNSDVQTLRTRILQAKAWAEAATFKPIAPSDPGAGREGWRKTGDAIEGIVTENGMTQPLQHMAGISAAGQTGDAEKFVEFSKEHQEWGQETHPEVWKTAKSETTFNRADLFGASMAAYVMAMAAIGIFWLFKKRWPRRAGMGLALGAFILMTIGLAWRMMIENRPPVTNLYSSAVFIAWACSGLAVYMEKIYKNGLGIFVGALAGFSGLIVAHHLSLAGDTMEAMRAVLDSNFWLATHVVIITLGYAATFVAGFIGAVALIWGLFGRRIQKQEENMVFGAVCFALLLSFVGTVLGGIWADQSWGRFWGWDPKENGALLIVLWNAVIIHGRLAGWLRRTGIMVTAVFGNAITAWSWFGTNMLGIGLHSYGFTDAAFFWLSAFVVVQIALMMLGWFQPDAIAKAKGKPPKGGGGDGGGKQHKANRPEPVGAQ